MIERAGERLSAVVGGWPGARIVQEAAGDVAYRRGERELGRLSDGALLVRLPATLGCELVSAGLALPVRSAPGSAFRLPLRDDTDLRLALILLRHCFDRPSEETELRAAS